MGSYTDGQRFYLIDSSELVSVDKDLNYNLQRADDRVRPLVEYVYTDEPSVTTSNSLVKGIGFKWYKTYNNSVVYSFDGTGAYEDGANSIAKWEVTGMSFETGYTSYDQDIRRVAYSEEDGWVRLRGSVIRDAFAELPLLVNTKFLTLPTSILPERSKYFFIHGGEATGNFQTFRIGIPSATAADKRLEFIKYGANASNSGERFFSLNDIHYPLLDTVV
jgi:hypothetical protein